VEAGYAEYSEAVASLRYERGARTACAEAFFSLLDCLEAGVDQTAGQLAPVARDLHEALNSCDGPAAELKFKPLCQEWAAQTAAMPAHTHLPPARLAAFKAQAEAGLAEYISAAARPPPARERRSRACAAAFAALFARLAADDPIAGRVASAARELLAALGRARGQAILQESFAWAERLGTMPAGAALPRKEVAELRAHVNDSYREYCDTL
jgi:hypothetical protein